MCYRSYDMYYNIRTIYFTPCSHVVQMCEILNILILLLITILSSCKYDYNHVPIKTMHFDQYLFIICYHQMVYTLNNK